MMNILEKIVQKIKLDHQTNRDRFHHLKRDYQRGELSRAAPLPIKPVVLAEDFLLIAECKWASPSKGVFRKNFDPVKIARDYLQGGAGAISVLVEENFFRGSESYFRQVRKEVKVPMLWKDFVVDLIQIIRAYTAGADLVLIIFRILDLNDYRKFLEVIIDLGMTPLVEVFNLEEIQQATDLPSNLKQHILLGINNRDLTSFQVDLNQSVKAKEYLDQSGIDLPVISESGISSYQEILFLKKHRFQGALVGESLLVQNDLVKATKNLLGDFD